MFLGDKKCRKCFFSKRNNGEMTYVCYLNPFKPVVMNYFSEHADRKTIKKDS